jgi:hypothetical protein
MIKNYILSALSNILRYRSFRRLIIMEQLSHDDFHPGRDRIFRVTTNNEMTDDVFTRFATAAYPMGDYLRK